MINLATQHSEDDLQSALCHFSAFKYLKLLKMEIKENVLSAAVLSVYCYAYPKIFSIYVFGDRFQP